MIQPSSSVQVRTPVPFTVAASSGAAPLLYSWDFGDGSAPTPLSKNATATHAYAAPGRYSVVLTVRNTFGRSSCALVQIIHNPLTALPAVSSSPIIHNGGRVFTVNPDNDTVAAIDEHSLTKAWEAVVGDNPRTLAEAPNSDIWVVNQDEATVSMLSASTGRLLGSIQLPFASRPYGIAFSPDGRAAYVTLQGTGRLLQLDPTGRIVGNIDMGPKPRGIAISGDARRILVTSFMSLVNQGEVREVDATTFRVVRVFGLAFDLGPDTEASGRGVPNYLSAIRMSPDGRRALIPSKKDNAAHGQFRDGQAFTFESLVRTIVSQLDLVNNTEDLSTRIDLNDRDMAQSVIFSPVGDIFFMATQGTNKVEIYDAYTSRLLGAMNTGLAPQGMVFNRNASKLYVQNFMSRTVSVFDTTEVVNAINNSAPFIG
jgi:DNA-binding beta-propeller fold protein YncE